MGVACEEPLLFPKVSEKRELLLAAWASLGGSWGPLAEKIQNERVKSKTPSLQLGFDVFLIKSSRPKVNETEDSMSNLARSRIRI